MAKFHDVQVDKLVKLSNFWYFKRTGKSGYNPVALKYPTKEYGDKFKKKLVEKRRKENDAITLALGGSPTFKGRACLKKKVTPTKEDLKEKKMEHQPSKQAPKTRKSTSPMMRDQEMGASKKQEQLKQTKATSKTTTTNKNNRNKTVTIAQEEVTNGQKLVNKDSEGRKTTQKVMQKLPKMDWTAMASAEYKRTLMKHTWRIDISFDVNTKIADSNNGERMAIALRQTL